MRLFKNDREPPPARPTQTHLRVIVVMARSSAPKTSSEFLMANIDSTLGAPTILLADDDASVRKYVHMVLRVHGYNILEAQSGMDALRISDAHPGVIDLLISDLNMPEMSGGELAEAMRQRRPETKILYLSGYPEDFLGVPEIAADGGFLQKPFTPSALAEKVRLILDH